MFCFVLLIYLVKNIIFHMKAVPCKIVVFSRET